MTSGRSSLGWIVGLLVLATPHILSVVRAADPAPVPAPGVEDRILTSVIPPVTFPP